MFLTRQLNVVTLVLSIGSTASAQTTLSEIESFDDFVERFAPSNIEKDELLGELDLATPENPLFTLMGTTPETVIKPKAGDKIMASIAPQVADAFGNETYAIAIEIAPSQFVAPEFFTLDELNGKADISGDIGPAGLTSRDRKERLDQAKRLQGLKLSLVANRSNEMTNKTQVGFGVSYVYDVGEPIRGQRRYSACLRKQDNKDSYDESRKTAFTEIYNTEIEQTAIFVAAFLKNDSIFTEYGGQDRQRAGLKKNIGI